LRPFLIALIITGTALLSINSLSKHPAKLRELLSDLLINSSFWFIPSQLISLLILVVLIKRVKQLYLGIFLFLLLSIITIRFVYLEPIIHTNFLFSAVFVFYYWLGTVFKDLDLVGKIKQVSFSLILLTWIGAFLLVNFETYFLWKSDYFYIFNNLKVSNQLYSIISFILLIRVSHFFKGFSVFNPRTETLGIYLYHTLFIVISKWIILKTFNTSNLGFLGALTFSFICFILTYTFTTIFVKVVKNNPLFYLNSKRSNGNFQLKEIFQNSDIKRSLVALR
jgi:hypothetical protein